MSELMKAIYTGANTSAYTNYILDMIPNSDLSYTDSDKNTAFMFACKYQLPEVALALLNTGQFKPDHINKFGMTALIYSCTRRMYDVAIALINTGQSNLNAVSRYKETALMRACYNAMSELAIALINAGADVKYKPPNKEDALFLAKKHKLVSVIKLIEEKKQQPKSLPTPAPQEKINFNINATAFDIIEGEDKPIVECLNEDNVVFVFYEKDVENSVKVSIPYSQLLDSYKNKNNYIVYECNRVDSMSSIKQDISYFDVKKLTGFGDLALVSDMDTIIKNDMNKIFIFQKSSKKLLTTVSYDILYNNANRIGARHCQTGQDGMVYNLIKNVIYTCEASQKTEMDRSVKRKYTAGKKVVIKSVKRKYTKRKKNTKRKKTQRI